MSDQLPTLDDVRLAVQEAVIEHFETWRQEALEMFSWGERTERKWSHLDRDDVLEVVLETLDILDHEVATALVVPE